MIISHLNSLPENVVHIEDALIKEPLELLCISETKLNESHLQDFSIGQYRTFRRDRPPNLCRNWTGGGVITWVRGDIPSSRRPDQESPNAETLCIELNVKYEKWLIICCYNPNSSMSESYMKKLSTLVDKSLTQYKFITVIDLNNNLLLEKCDVNKHVLDFMNTHAMHNIKNKPSCFKNPDGTLLDVFVTSNKNRFLKSGSFNTGLNDFHHLIYGVLRTGFP